MRRADRQAGCLERNSEVLREEFSDGCGGSDGVDGDVGLGKRGAESTEESYELVEAYGRAVMSATYSIAESESSSAKRENIHTACLVAL